MDKNEYELAWNLMAKLGDEILASKQIRSQIIGFKITFISAALALIAANIDKLPNLVILVIPAFAAIFFDLLINSYSRSIERIGDYSRFYLEPIIKKETAWPNDTPLWEEYVHQSKSDETKDFIKLIRKGRIGNFGMTILASLPAAYYIFKLDCTTAIVLSIILVLFLIYDLITSLNLKRYKK